MENNSGVNNLPIITPSRRSVYQGNTLDVQTYYRRPNKACNSNSPAGQQVWTTEPRPHFQHPPRFLPAAYPVEDYHSEPEVDETPPPYPGTSDGIVHYRLRDPYSGIGHGNGGMTMNIDRTGGVEAGVNLHHEYENVYPRQTSLNNPIPVASVHPLFSSPKPKKMDWLEQLQNAQAHRLDDQRCDPPKPDNGTLKKRAPLPGAQETARNEEARKKRELDQEKLKELLSRNQYGSYPLIVQPTGGGFWIDGVAPDETLCSNYFPGHFSSIQDDFAQIAKTYGTHFYGKEHLNYTGRDESVGYVVLSLMKETGEEGQRQYRTLLRTKSGTLHSIIPSTQQIDDNWNAACFAKMMCDKITNIVMLPVAFPTASDIIRSYDEHVLVNRYKFGIIYQKANQTTEEEMFSNRYHSPAMDEFLSLLGKRTKLQGFKGFVGGLDTKDNQTGEESVYTKYNEAELMFHVSTLLPYTENDPQQLQRKRHIGNDIVTIVFQEENTPFMPTIVTSHFIHVFIVVQPIRSNHNYVTGYRVAVTARLDVPFFQPKLPTPAEFSKGVEFRDFLLSKLVNAEQAALKANKFSELSTRTRASLLEDLNLKLGRNTEEFVAPMQDQSRSESKDGSNPNLFDQMLRKAKSIRSRSTTNDKHGSDTGFSTLGSSSSSGDVSKTKKSLFHSSNTYESGSPKDKGWTGALRRNPKSRENLQQHGRNDFQIMDLATKTNTISSVDSHQTPPSPALSTNSSASSNSMPSDVITDQQIAAPSILQLQQPVAPSMSNSNDLTKQAVRLATMDPYYMNGGYTSDQHSGCGPAPTTPDAMIELIDQIGTLNREVTKLRKEKMEYHRRNSDLEREVRQLKDKELRLTFKLQNLSRSTSDSESNEIVRSSTLP